MCSAHRLIVLYICVKFHGDISDGIRNMEQMQMTEALKDGWPLKISMNFYFTKFCDTIQ